MIEAGFACARGADAILNDVGGFSSYPSFPRRRESSDSMINQCVRTVNRILIHNQNSDRFALRQEVVSR